MQKKQVRKLSLNRETVRNLNDQELSHANGGTLLSLPVVCDLSIICSLITCP